MGGADQQTVLGHGSLTHFGELGDPEVGDLQHPILADQQVVGLDVPVDDALLVGRGQAGVELNPQPDRFVGRDLLSLLDDAGDGLASHQLHHQKDDLLVHAGFVDGHHVGVTQAGGRLGLLTKPADEVLLGERLEVVIGANGLDGGRTLQKLVHGFVDHPEGPLSEYGFDPVLLGNQVADLDVRGVGARRGHEAVRDSTLSREVPYPKGCRPPPVIRPDRGLARWWWGSSPGPEFAGSASAGARGS